jgi:hypothetical protein
MYVNFFFKIHKLLIIIFLLNIILFNSLLIGDSQGAAIDTDNETEYYKHDGILQYVLRNMT